MSNNFTPDGTGLLTPEGTSAAQEIAKAAPASAHVVKAFNTVFGNALAQDRHGVGNFNFSLDVNIPG